MALAKDKRTPTEINRRHLLTAVPAAGFAALAVGAVPVEAACAMQVEAAPTRAEQIAHHRAELFRLFAEEVPEGAELTGLTAIIDRSGMDFEILSARDEVSTYVRDHSGAWSRFSR